MDDTINNLKDSIRDELNLFKKEKSNKVNTKTNKTKQTSKEVLENYFNQIKKNSKLNISHNSNFSNIKNIEINSLEISDINNDLMELKTQELNNNNLNNNLNNNNLYNNSNINSQNKNILNNNLNDQKEPENFIIFETFKNMLKTQKDKNLKINKLNDNKSNINTINNNINNTKIITARFNTFNTENSKKEIDEKNNKYGIITEEDNKENIYDSKFFNNLKYNDQIDADIIKNKNIDIEFDKNFINENNLDKIMPNNMQLFTETEQLSIINDINNIKEFKETPTNNIFISPISTNTNKLINNNYNPLLTKTTITKNDFKNNYTYNIMPQTVSNFSMTKDNKDINTDININNNCQNSNITKITNKKYYNYYKKDYFKLKRKYDALLGKYKIEKKKNEALNLKVFFTEHKNDNKFEYLQNQIKTLILQLKSSNEIYENLNTLLNKMQKEINDKNNLLTKQDELIKGFMNQSINDLDKLEYDNNINNTISNNTDNKIIINNTLNKTLNKYIKNI